MRAPWPPEHPLRDSCLFMTHDPAATGIVLTFEQRPISAARQPASQPTIQSHSLMLMHMVCGGAVDLCVSLGGDGTVLHLASLFEQDLPLPPVVSFAMGTLGFLTPFDVEGYQTRLTRVLQANTHRVFCTLRTRKRCEIRMCATCSLPTPPQPCAQPRHVAVARVVAAVQ